LQNQNDVQMKTLIYAVAVLFLCSACGSASQLQKKGSVAAESFHTEITFETLKGIIMLNAEIDGVDKTFLFDTGADLSLRQREEMIGKVSKYGGASKRKMELGREKVNSIKIGDVEFKNTISLNGDMIGLKEQIPNFGGLIGLPIIQKANWLIDYPNNRMEIANTNLADNSFKEIELVRDGGNAPYTFIDINGETYKVIIDLGSSSTINFPADSKVGIEVASQLELSDNTRHRYTLGGLQEIEEKVGTIPKVRIGDFDLKDVNVNFNTSSRPRVGINFFKDFMIYIDNSHGGSYKLKRVKNQ